MRLQIGRKSSRLKSPLLHALLGGGQWDIMTLDAVMPDGSGMTRRVSLLAASPEQPRPGTSTATSALCYEAAPGPVLRLSSVRGSADITGHPPSTSTGILSLPRRSREGIQCSVHDMPVTSGLEHAQVWTLAIEALQHQRRRTDRLFSVLCRMIDSLRERMQRAAHLRGP